MILCLHRYIFLLNNLSGGKSCSVAPGVAVPPWATETVLSAWLAADEARVLHVLSHVEKKLKTWINNNSKIPCSMRNLNLFHGKNITLVILSQFENNHNLSGFFFLFEKIIFKCKARERTVLIISVYKTFGNKVVY